MKDYFKHNISYLRNRNGLSQEQLAHELGMAGHTTIQSYESGRAFPRLEKLLLITNYFGVSINRIIGGRLNDKNINNGNVLDSVAAEIRSFIDATDNQMLIKAHKIDLDIISRHKKTIHYD